LKLLGLTLKKRMARPVGKGKFTGRAGLRINVSVCGWPLSSKKNLTLSSGGRLQSCVRPIDAALRPLAQMGVRGLGLIGLSGS
jgi:hypothetical protein